MTFTNLQNGYYNFMMQALGLTNASNFQLIQPAPPFPTNTTNAALWAWMNNIPPLALSQSGGGGDQFFSDYEAVFSSLKPNININFAGDVGPVVAAAWDAYTANLPPTIAVTQYPGLFYNWAFTHGHYSEAEIGASDLAAMLLEPISRAQLALQPYLTITGVAAGRAPDWSLGYPQLVSELAVAPAKSLTSANVQSNANVSGSWAASGSSGGFFLWGGGSSSSGSSISANFSSQAVSAHLSFSHALSFVPVPGAWYDSAAFGLAYSTQSGLPWNPAAPETTWANTFGPSGNMQRFASSLIVVSGMEVSMTSSYAFSSAEQTTITQNAGGGFWPFYQTSSGSSMTTSHSFNKAGNLTIVSSSPTNVPMLVGMTVLPAANYLGYATRGRTKYLVLSEKFLTPAIAAAVKG